MNKLLRYANNFMVLQVVAVIRLIGSTDAAIRYWDKHKR